MQIKTMSRSEISKGQAIMLLVLQQLNLGGPKQAGTCRQSSSSRWVSNLLLCSQTRLKIITCMSICRKVPWVTNIGTLYRRWLREMQPPTSTNCKRIYLPQMEKFKLRARELGPDRGIWCPCLRKLITRQSEEFKLVSRRCLMEDLVLRKVRSF